MAYQIDPEATHGLALIEFNDLSYGDAAGVLGMLKTTLQILGRVSRQLSVIVEFAEAGQWRFARPGGGMPDSAR